MKVIIVVALVSSGMSGASLAQSMSFDKDRAGAPPTNWSCGLTGNGNPRWTVEPEPDGFCRNNDAAIKFRLPTLCFGPQ
jgi:hypothetical protein